jgi:sec-independent protein translocase protein TatA
VGALQPYHLVVILIIVVMIFGLGRLPTVGSALAKGVKDFRANLQDDQRPPTGGSLAAFCPRCGTGVTQRGAGFCPRCGAHLPA